MKSAEVTKDGMFSVGEMECMVRFILVRIFCLVFFGISQPIHPKMLWMPDLSLIQHNFMEILVFYRVVVLMLQWSLWLTTAMVQKDIHTIIMWVLMNSLMHFKVLMNSVIIKQERTLNTSTFHLLLQKYNWSYSSKKIKELNKLSLEILATHLAKLYLSIFMICHFLLYWMKKDLFYVRVSQWQLYLRLFLDCLSSSNYSMPSSSGNIVDCIIFGITTMKGNWLYIWTFVFYLDRHWLYEGSTKMTLCLPA